jgi:sigma-B regulation protein RsbU (phosphoserine phosphatase)
MSAGEFHETLTRVNHDGIGGNHEGEIVMNGTVEELETTQYFEGEALATVRPERVYGSSLLRVAEVFEFVPYTERVTDLAQRFQGRPELMAVGVCDAEGKPLGLITRVHLFDRLGKPFGRDVLSRKSVVEVVETAEVFDMNANLFQTAEKLQATMDRSTVHYYVLVDGEGKYRGLFSSKDLLAYLSKITQEDIHLAGQLQERLVKARLSQKGEGWSVEAFSQSAKGLGGDFYHVMPLPDGRLFLALGDVSGKGVAASVLTSLLWGVLQFYDYRKGLRRLLAQVNEALIRTFHLEKYLTGVFLIFDPATRELTMADMGHGHSWLVREGKTRPMRFGGPSGASGLNLPLGIDLELNPQVFRVKLRPGDLLCLYTDGLVEQEDEAGQEFGESSVVQHLRELWKTPEAIPETLLEHLAKHQGSVPRLDDVSWTQLRAE